MYTQVYVIPDTGKGSITCKTLAIVVELIMKVLMSLLLFSLMPFLYHSTLTCGDMTAGKCNVELTVNGTCT